MRVMERDVYWAEIYAGDRKVYEGEYDPCKITNGPLMISVTFKNNMVVSTSLNNFIRYFIPKGEEIPFNITMLHRLKDEIKENA